MYFWFAYLMRHEISVSRLQKMRAEINCGVRGRRRLNGRVGGGERTLKMNTYIGDRVERIQSVENCKKVATIYWVVSF